jgi:hypothetical protein
MGTLTRTARARASDGRESTSTVSEVAHEDVGDSCAELFDEALEQVVCEWTRDSDILEPDGNRVGF